MRGAILLTQFILPPLWRSLLPKAELWEAEFDGECVKKAVANGLLKGINPLVGDQKDPATLEEWVEKSGGNFDVIIDDGGHKNSQIKAAFDRLWIEVNYGGFYFIEDLQVGRSWEPKPELETMSQIIQDWIDQLLVGDWNVAESRQRHPLPQDVAFITCQLEACVIAKTHAKFAIQARPGGGKRQMHQAPLPLVENEQVIQLLV